MAHKKIIISSICILALAIGGYSLYRATRPTSPASIYNPKVARSNSNVPGNTKPNSTSGITSGSGTKGDQGTTTTPSTGSQPNSNVSPATPLGQFVSNHHPNLSGKPAPNTETSTCTTTPNVDCQIQFIDGTITKSLPLQKTDVNGNTEWNWTLQNIGLTVGTWQVIAIASNGNKTASAHDAMQLVVKQ